jgi:WD40 repeat protein/serine/threonine protein kinase/tetratricopeptide (TPR) repeat protein
MTMSASTSGPDLFNRLADEFAERYRRGERPPLAEYTDQYPELADEIRELFPALVAIEQFGSGAEEATGPVSPQPEATRPIPEWLGDYRIVREIARGGMGIVYEAIQESLGRHVALKVLPQHRLGDPSQLERFRRESRAAAMLHHTNIVPVYAVGCERGIHYYAMQLIAGETLGRVVEELRQIDGPRADVPSHANGRAFALASGLSSGPLASTEPRLDASPSTASCASPAEPLPAQPDRPRTPVPSWGTSNFSRAFFQNAARLGIQAAEALDHAHQQGILHRDIKPSNLLVDARGNLWITDFGLARLQSEASLTMTGDVLGTLRYMSPEQALAKRLLIDHRTDIYSLGATLYELLTLHPVFEGHDRQELLRQIAFTEPRPLRKLNPSTPRELETIVLKALAKDPASRYATAQGLADDLRRFLEYKPIRAKRPTIVERAAKWSRRHTAAVWSALLILMMTVVSLSLGLVLIEEERAKTEHQLYVNLVGRAHAEWLANQADLAEQLLDACPVSWRGWEWSLVKRLCHLELLTWRGHRGKVQCVAFSPDGGRIASGAGESAEGDLAVWDPATGREVFTRHRLPNAIASLAFSPDGQRIVTGSGLNAVQGELSLWDAATGAELLRHDLPYGRVNGVAFSGDGRWIGAALGMGDVTAGTMRGQLELRDAGTGAVIRMLPESRGEVSAVDFSLDSRRVAFAGPDGVSLWDPCGPWNEPTLFIPAGKVKAVAFSPDGRRLATVSRGAGIELWDTASGSKLLHLPGPADGATVTCATFSPDGRLLASSGEDLSVKVWDLAAGAVIATFRGHSGAVSHLAFSPDGHLLASAGRDRMVKIWDAKRSRQITLRALTTAEGVSNGILGAALGPDGRRAITADRAGSLMEWDATSGELIRRLGGRGPAWSAAFRPDGKQVAVAQDDWTIRLWDMEVGCEVNVLRGHLGRVFDVAFSPDGRLLASAGDDWSVRLWDPTNGQLLATLDAHDEPVLCVAFSPDGRLLASGAGLEPWRHSSTKGELVVWDVASGRGLYARRGLRGGLLDLAFSPDSRTLISAYNGPGATQGEMAIWDVTGGRESLVVRNPGGSAWSVAFSPDGRRLVTAGADRAIRIWEAATGQELLTLRGHGSDVLSVAFSPDGRTLISGAKDGTARVWEAAPPSADSATDGISSVGRRPVPSTPRPGTSPSAHARVSRTHPWVHDSLLAHRLIHHPDPRSRDLPRALALARRSVARAPRSRGCWDTLADVCLEAERWHEAEGALSRVAELPPNFASSHFRLAWLLATCPDLRVREIPGALHHSRKAVALHPGGWLPWQTLGVSLYRAGDWEAAIAALERSASLRSEGYSTLWFSKESAINWYFRAMTYWKLGERDKARVWYERAVEWMEKNAPDQQELLRFRAEAAELLGLSHGADRKGRRAPTDEASQAELVPSAVASAARARARWDNSGKVPIAVPGRPPMRP